MSTTSTSPSPTFWLKTVPVTPKPTPTEHHDGVNPDGSLYLRHHGSGHNAIMLMPAPPKFLKGHFDEEKGRVLLTSASHAGREWGLVMQASGTEGQRAGWEPVEIVEKEGDKGFEWVDQGNGEELIWKGRGGESEEIVNGGWRGWMCTDWAYAHHQLFWVTDKLKEEVGLPSSAEWVRVVRVPTA